MPLNPKFSKHTSSSTLIATYSGTDIATGKGNAIYYLMRDLAGTEFLSTSSGGYSTNGSQRNTAAIDLDFDVEILNTTVFEGDAVVSIAIEDYSGASAATPTLTATLRHYDGSTETDLVSANGSQSIAINTSEVWTLKLAVPKTTFNIGDTLRLTIGMTARTDVNHENQIWFDPSGLYVTSPTVRSTLSTLTMPVTITT